MVSFLNYIEHNLDLGESSFGINKKHVSYILKNKLKRALVNFKFFK